LVLGIRPTVTDWPGQHLAIARPGCATAGTAAVVRRHSRGRGLVWLRRRRGQARKSRAAFGPVTADQNSSVDRAVLWW